MCVYMYIATVLPNTIITFEHHYNTLRMSDITSITQLVTTWMSCLLYILYHKLSLEETFYHTDNALKL